MRWATRDGDGWRLVGPRQFEVGGVIYPGWVLLKWTDAALDKIGVERVLESDPTRKKAVGPWSLRDVEGYPVWAPAAWEDEPPEPMPVLTALQFWGMVLTLDAAGLDLSRRMNEAGADDPVVELALAHANAFEWGRFVALAASKATEAELAALAAAWRAAAEGGA